MICNAVVVRRTAIPAVLAALALLASAACSDGGADKGTAGANPTLATDPPRTNPTLATVPAPTTTTNPYAVPATIDAAYINRVLAGLDATLGDATRLVIQTKTVPREAYDRLKSLYATDPRLQLAIDGLQTDLRNGFSGYSDRPGDRRTTVAQLVAASKTCIFVRVSRDYSAIGPGARPPSDKNWIVLRPLDSARDPNHYNLTNWTYHYDGFTPDQSQPTNPCAS
jgi:hypothetical protein